MDGRSPLPPRFSSYPARLPGTLTDLHGPCSGTVRLPLHVAWSGKREYDLDDPKQQLPLYALLLAEAQAPDLVDFVNPELLLRLWPRLRTMLGPVQQRAWDGLVSAATYR
jgi:hypothetical protein